MFFYIDLAQNSQNSQIFKDHFLEEDKLPRRSLTKPRIPRSERQRGECGV